MILIMAFWIIDRTHDWKHQAQAMIGYSDPSDRVQECAQVII